ncbi:unnamed protein product [Schistosoma spindalis]|nr:unnamed protein product [Schistosoma spindale]
MWIEIQYQTYTYWLLLEFLIHCVLREKRNFTCDWKSEFRKNINLWKIVSRSASLLICSFHKFKLFE